MAGRCLYNLLAVISLYFSSRIKGTMMDLEKNVPGCTVKRGQLSLFDS